MALREALRDGVPDVLKAAPVLSGLAEGDVHLSAERVGVDGGGGDGVGVLLGPFERGEHVRACVFDDWMNGGGDVTSGSLHDTGRASGRISSLEGCRGNATRRGRDAPAKASRTATTMNPVESPPDGGGGAELCPRAGEPVDPSAMSVGGGR